ncbi:MAG TPA: AI-2E family transporter YdiK [Vicinamibacterales bacterium]|nr:AI-2E family transporter YdiK [Vicinamibacterales bacterium]
MATWSRQDDAKIRRAQPEVLQAGAATVTMTDTLATPPPQTDLPGATLGVLIIVTLIALTIWILRPFLAAIVWALMIVVATWPVMSRLQAWLWGRRTLAVAAMIGALLLLLVLPLSLAIGTIVANTNVIVEWASTLRSFTLPPPPAWLGSLPLVGTQAVEAWQKIAASRPADVASAATPYAAAAILWMAGTMRGVGLLLVQFLLTLALAAVMYANGERAAEGLLRFGRRLAGEPGDRVVRLAAQAIRSVALGVVVTAIVQATLGGIGLAAAGVPFAALLTAVAFVLCIAQVGPMPVLAPAVAWLYWHGAVGSATALLVWTLVVVTLDNVLRPILMTKGANLPMLLMFAGVIGGLLAFGLIGIFIGPVVLAVSYTLLGAWLGGRPPSAAESDVPAAEG